MSGFIRKGNNVNLDMTSLSRRKSFGTRRNDGSGGNGPSPFSAYDAACRDRWVNVSKNMMGERAEIAMSCGTIYDGVIHVIAPAVGSRGVYQVKCFFGGCGFPRVGVPSGTFQSSTG